MIKYVLEKNPVPLMQDNIHLLMAQKDELNRYGDWDLDPDWTRYQELVDSEVVHVVVAWKEDIIVGYTVNLIFRHLHYNFTMGYNDIIYLIPKYRGHGLRLIRETEKYMKILGVEVFNISVKPHVDFSKVLERLGYKLIEYEYARRL